ncbi:hypothetical protein D3C87_70060 [compost metagenome]
MPKYLELSELNINYHYLLRGRKRFSIKDFKIIIILYKISNQHSTSIQKITTI